MPAKLTRKQVLELVRVEFAMHGKDTGLATRLLIEERISRAAWNAAANQGLAAYNARAKKGTE